jgi:cyclopropane-fatty-acyl-phospholipid synthase
VAGAATDLVEIAAAVLGTSLPMRIRAWDGTEAGAPSGDAAVTIVVRSPDAVRRLLWSPDELGLARAYVAGDLDVEGSIFDLLGLRDVLAPPDDPSAPMRASIRGRAQLLARARRLGALGPPLPPPPEEARLRGRLHSRQRDRDAISHHYDVGNAFYRLVLGPSLTYSCAYFPDDTATLEEAQAAKHELICRKLGLVEGDRLLDVGCGWGSLALHAAQQHGARVVGVTISVEQARLARERIAQAGLGDRVEIRVQDYRDVDDGPFDAISSVGMFEHVGLSRTGEYFERLTSLLRPGGRFLNHAISRPRSDHPAGFDPKGFPARYVFPDGELLEVGAVVTVANGTGLEVRDVESLREHYARTLRQWVANLASCWDEAVDLVGEGRARVWLLYMAGSAVSFEARRLTINQVLCVRPHVDGRSDMPATRRGFVAGSEVIDLRTPPTSASADGERQRGAARRSGAAPR